MSDELAEAHEDASFEDTVTDTAVVILRTEDFEQIIPFDIRLLESNHFQTWISEHLGEAQRAWQNRISTDVPDAETEGHRVLSDVSEGISDQEGVRPDAN